LLGSAGQRALRRDDISAARTLLSRALQLGSSADQDDFAISLSLAEALRLGGESYQADEVLTEMQDRATALGDQVMEWRARVQRVELFAEAMSPTLAEVRSTLDEAIDVFTTIGDDWGLAKTWGTIAWLEYSAGRATEAGGANMRAASHARSAGDTTEELWNLVSLTTRAVEGPTSVAEALDLCGEVLDKIKGEPGLEAAVHLSRGQLEAMRGNFEAARAAIKHARSVWRDLGVTHLLAGVTLGAATVEWLAQNLPGAEHELRSGYDEFRRRGANAYLATWAAVLARALVELGRDDEALELSRESEELAADDDISSLVPWHGARAKVLARRGDADEAERLARNGVSIAERTDWLNLRGDALVDLAEVLRLAGRVSEAAETLREAGERYGQKGNTVSAARVQTLIKALAAST
jgi:ATP/maltotriose-dependent transcriptional regulator MalT